MHRSVVALIAACGLLAGCVTVNVYFPAAAAQQAADKVIGNIIGPEGQGVTPAPASSAPPSASTDHAAWRWQFAARVVDAVVPTAAAAEPKPNLHVRTPAIEAIEARMRDRYHSVLRGLLDSGTVGFTHNGNVAIRDAAKIPLARRAQVRQVVAAENADRADLYKQIALANGHPQWAGRLREAFAKRWIAMARPGWYYQGASGQWRRK